MTELPYNLFNKDEPFFSIGKKWIDYAQSKGDNNDIAVAIWAAIKETRNVNTWVLADDELPPDETPVLIMRNGILGIGEIRWDHPGHEDNYSSYRYWDDPNNDGQCWDMTEITHWMYKPDIKL